LPKPKDNIDVENDTPPQHPCKGRLFKDRAERLEQMRAMRDHALQWVAECIEGRKGRGIGGATRAIESMQEQIDKLKADMGIDKPQQDTEFKWLEYRADAD
jgi:hypothetical protein